VSRLFIELYLDEDVDVLVANLLYARGFAALTTREAGRLGSDDVTQLAYAVSLQKPLSRTTVLILRCWPRRTSRQASHTTALLSQSATSRTSWSAACL
jgi:hypothetical protein